MERLAVDVREAARLLSISPHTVRTYIRRGKIQAVHFGRRVAVPVSECERLAREGLPVQTKDGQPRADGDR